AVIISGDRAALIVRLTQHLDSAEAAAAEAKILGRAGRLTPGGLRSAPARAGNEGAPGQGRAPRWPARSSRSRRTRRASGGRPQRGSPGWSGGPRTPATPP